MTTTTQIPAGAFDDIKEDIHQDLKVQMREAILQIENEQYELAFQTLFYAAVSFEPSEVREEFRQTRLTNQQARLNKKTEASVPQPVRQPAPPTKKVHTPLLGVINYSVRAYAGSKDAYPNCATRAEALKFAVAWVKEHTDNMPKTEDVRGVYVIIDEMKDTHYSYAAYRSWHVSLKDGKITKEMFKA